MAGIPRSFFSVELCFSLTNSFALHREAQRVLAPTCPTPCCRRPSGPTTGRSPT